MKLERGATEAIGHGSLSHGSFCFFFQKEALFFFEKKNQKTFDQARRGLSAKAPTVLALGTRLFVRAKSPSTRVASAALCGRRTAQPT
jgi:hypothetical protein